MPKEKEVTNHPCHLLSLPSAKRFWCRHCMTVFEDAITRWRHSRSCRYGSVNNFMRRRELEAKALQNTTALNPVEARLEQSIQMCDLASTSAPYETDPSYQTQMFSNTESFNCFICHKKFASMEEMRTHVKYPCSSSKIITSHVPHPKHSVPVFIDALPGQTNHWQPSSRQEVHQATTTFVQVHNPHPNSAQTTYGIEIHSQQEMESQYDGASVTYDHNGSSTSDGITPTNIYVNEQGETVIEVENLDLNTEGGELSLAHLLTQLSQQGIVFDKTRSAELQTSDEVTVTGTSANTLYTTNENFQSSIENSKIVEEEEQPTAEDAANTLAQLAGLRSFTRINELKQSQVHSVQNYSYNNSIPGPSNHYTANTQPQIDINYGYSYSDTPATSGHPTVANQKIAFQQSLVSSNQTYDNVKLEQEEIDDTLNFYTDSSNVTYITGQDNHHEIHVQAGEISNNDYTLNHGDIASDGNHSVLIHSYPVEVDGSGQLTNMSMDMPASQISKTQNHVICEEIKAYDSAMKFSTVHENNTHIRAHSSQNKETTIKAQDNKLKTVSTKLGYIEISPEGDVSTIQTVSLQEILRLAH